MNKIIHMSAIMLSMLSTLTLQASYIFNCCTSNTIVYIESKLIVPIQETPDNPQRQLSSPPRTGPESPKRIKNKYVMPALRLQATLNHEDLHKNKRYSELEEIAGDTAMSRGIISENSILDYVSFDPDKLKILYEKILK